MHLPLEAPFTSAGLHGTVLLISLKLKGHWINGPPPGRSASQGFECSSELGSAGWWASPRWLRDQEKSWSLSRWQLCWDTSSLEDWELADFINEVPISSRTSQYLLGRLAWPFPVLVSCTANKRRRIPLFEFNIVLFVHVKTGVGEQNNSNSSGLF